MKPDEVSRQTEALPREKPFTHALPWVALVSLMFLFVYLARAIFGPLLPAIEEEFGISHAASTRFLLYLSIGFAVSTFLSGYVSSKIRPRVMVGGSLILSGFVLLAISTAANLPLLTILFIALGLSSGQYFNGGLSTLRSLVPLSQWSKAISIHEMGPNISFFVAPLLAGVGVAMFGWRGVSIGMGCLTIGGGLFFLLFAKGGESPSAPLSFGGFAKALKEPKLWLFTWLAGLGIAGEFAPFSVLTLHMLNERSLSPELAALLLSTSRIAAPIALLGGGFVTTRFGVRRTLYVCLAVYALGMFCMAMPWFPVFALGLFVQPVVTAMIFPPAFTFLAESFPPKDQPMYLSIGMPLAALMGAGFMPSILGIWGDLTGFSVGFAMMGCLAALSLPLLRLAPGKSRQ